MMASNVSRDVSQDQSSVVQTCKPWYAFATVAAGRFVRFASRVTKHGGSALPGKVVEKIHDLRDAKDPYSKKLLASVFTIEEGKNKVLPDELFN